MLALVLVGGLLLSRAAAAPNLCAGSCDDSKFGGSSYGQKSSYSSSSYSSGGSSRGNSAGSQGLGSRGGRLETLDDNVVQTFGSGPKLERPGNWNEEKHYVTDDGHGEMNYKAGQTVTGNGFSKFSEHSYRYGSQDKFAPRANSQILSVAEFDKEMKSLRERISSFMGSYRSDSGSLVDAGFLRNFDSDAKLISSQINSACEQVSKGSSQWQEMQRMMQDFEREYQETKSKLQARHHQQESRFSGSSFHSQSSYHQHQQQLPEYSQERPFEPLVRPSIPSDSQLRQEQRQQEQRQQQQQQEQLVQQKLTTCRELMREFYSEFNRAETSQQYQQQLGSRSEQIHEKLAELRKEAGRNEQQLAEVSTLEAQFSSFVSQLRGSIHRLEAQQRDEEQRYQDRLRKLEEDKRSEEARLSQMEARQREQLAEQTRLEQQKLQLEQQRMQLESESRERKSRLESERLQLEQQRARIEQQHSERLRILEQERAHMLEQQSRLQQSLPTPSLPALQPLEQRQPSDFGLRQQQASSSSSYEASYNVSSSSSSTTRLEHSSGGGSSANLQRQQQQQQQRVLEPHVDMTARVNRLQQDLNRLHSDLNSFKIDSARLSSENSAFMGPQLTGQAESLRQGIQGLCDKSERYHSADVLQRAQQLKDSFEAEFGRFQTSLSELGSSSSSLSQQQQQQQQQRQDGFSSESSWSSSGRVSSVKPPRLSRVELERSSSVDVEVGLRPAAASRSSYSASYGSSASSSYGSGAESSSRYSADCVEAASGQPCVAQLHQRQRRQAPEEYRPRFNSNSRRAESLQRYQPIFNMSPGHGRVSEFSEHRPITDQLKDYLEQQPTSQIGILQLDPRTGNVRVPELSRASSSNARHLGSKQLNQDDASYPLGSMTSTQNRGEYRGRPMEVSAEERRGVDDYYRPGETQSRYSQATRSGNSDRSQRIQDPPQQTTANQNDDFELFQRPRSENAFALTDVRNRAQKQPMSSSNAERNYEDVGLRQSFEKVGERTRDGQFQRLENLREEPGEWNSASISSERPEERSNGISSRQNSKESIESTGANTNPHSNVKIGEFQEIDSGIRLVQIEEPTEKAETESLTRQPAVSNEPTLSQSNGLHASQNRKSNNQNREFASDEVTRFAEPNENNERRKSGRTNYGFVQKLGSESAISAHSSKTDADGEMTRMTIDDTNYNGHNHQNVESGSFSIDNASKSTKDGGPNESSKTAGALMTPAPDTEKIILKHPNINLSRQKMQNLSDYNHHSPQELHLPEFSTNEEILYPYGHTEGPRDSEPPTGAEWEQLAPINEPVLKSGSNPILPDTRPQQENQAHDSVPQHNVEKNDKPHSKPVRLRGDLPGILEPEPTAPEPFIESTVSEISIPQILQTTTEVRPGTNRYVHKDQKDQDGRGECLECPPKQQTEQIDLGRYNNEDLYEGTRNEQHHQVTRNNSFGISSDGTYQFNHRSHFHHQYQYTQKTNNFGQGNLNTWFDFNINRPSTQQSSQRFLHKSLDSTGDGQDESSIFHHHRLHSSEIEHVNIQPKLKSTEFDQNNFSRYYKQSHSSQLIDTPHSYQSTHWFDNLKSSREKEQSTGSRLYKNLLDSKLSGEC